MSLGKAMIHARKPKNGAQGRALTHESAEPHEGWPGQRVSSAYTMQKPVLVLNASYEPINICGARRALILVLKGVAKTEEEQGAILHAALLRIPMPSVIRLLEYRRIPHQTRALSRKNILLRDRNSCQYCGVVSTWENLVACCHSCNRRKGNHLLNEISEIKLLREPRPFSLHTSRHIMRMIGHSDNKWRKYLYY
jgi:5-methylcytosine-specific restriction endonuclease McrA